jgi:hypothetical protein
MSAFLLNEMNSTTDSFDVWSKSQFGADECVFKKCCKNYKKKGKHCKKCPKK